MSVEIQFLSFNEVKGFRQVVKTAAEATLQDQEVDNGILSIVLTDEADICRFNRMHAGIDEPTDVLAFPDGAEDPETGATILGDVIMCPPVAQQGAANGRHSLLDELCMLTIHGTLHLLGYDHKTEDQKAEMWKAQARILERLGSPVHPG
jgi:probable rRNA maturation factor